MPDDFDECTTYHLRDRATVTASNVAGQWRSHLLPHSGSATRNTARQHSSRRRIVEGIVKWSEEFIEQPHEIFGGLPVCPFARAARLKQTIRFEVRHFDLDDTLEPHGDIMTLVREFADQDATAGHFETLFVVHPDSRQGLPALLAFVARLNVRMSESGLSEFQAFEAHPQSDFRVGKPLHAAFAVSELPGSQSHSVEEGLGLAAGLTLLLPILVGDASRRRNAPGVIRLAYRSCRAARRRKSLRRPWHFSLVV